MHTLESSIGYVLHGPMLLLTLALVAAAGFAAGLLTEQRRLITHRRALEQRHEQLWSWERVLNYRRALQRNRADRHHTGPTVWTCPYCPFTADGVDAGLTHIADHESGRAVAMTDALLAEVYAQPGRHRVRS
jgi:hypothetical protein